jgi:hypothetical protein
VVTVIDIFEDDDGELTAVIRVNDTLYEVGEGDQFLTFRVDSIDPPCVDLMNGDADTFQDLRGRSRPEVDGAHVPTGGMKLTPGRLRDVSRQDLRSSAPLSVPKIRAVPIDDVCQGAVRA